ncbi:MAG TPA: hypothetical protein VK699_02635 [Terriglobales bacterium]|nr:hypothetical protein [Terriglobales bacterium]
MAGKPNFFVSFYKIFRWVVLVVAFVVIFMMLGKPPRPSLPMSREDAKQQAQSYEQKWDQLVLSPPGSEGAKAHFTSDEITAGINRQIAGPVPVAASNGAGQPKSPELAPDSQVADDAPIRNVDVDFHGNEFTGQAIVNVHGKDVYITISGRLGSNDGYATFEPTNFKVGDLTIPISLVNDALQKKLAEPENREKLKLPDFVQSIRIENGELVVEKKD